MRLPLLLLACVSTLAARSALAQGARDPAVWAATDCGAFGIAPTLRQDHAEMQERQDFTERALLQDPNRGAQRIVTPR